MKGHLERSDNEDLAKFFRPVDYLLSDSRMLLSILLKRMVAWIVAR
jgi:hypothetical protein